MRKMAISKNHLILFLMLWCSEIILLSDMVSAQCHGDLQGLIQQCSKYVQKPGAKQEPSKGCCNVVKNVDIPCACAHITKEVEQIISMEKAVYIADFCGKPLPHGTKCGDYIVP